MNAAKTANVAEMRGVRRSGPCIMGGVSPSLHHARQSVTGPIFTGPALPTGVLLQYGFHEPNSTPVGVPASSGSSQSQELTKASRRTPLFPARYFILVVAIDPLTPALSPRGEGDSGVPSPLGEKDRMRGSWKAFNRIWYYGFSRGLGGNW